MSAEHEYAIELQGVSFQRGARSIFDKVDIRIPRGKVTGIMGPSGCGKTTLLRLIAAELRPSAGDVRVAGVSLPKLSRDELFDMRKTDDDPEIMPEIMNRIAEPIYPLAQALAVFLFLGFPTSNRRGQTLPVTMAASSAFCMKGKARASIIFSPFATAPRIWVQSRKQ